MDLIRDEAERQRRAYEEGEDYDGDNSSNDNDDDEDEDEDEKSEEDSESDESDESESSSSGSSSGSSGSSSSSSSEEENDSEMDDDDELEDMSRVSMSECESGIQDEGDLRRFPPRGSIFGDEDMDNHDDGHYDQGSSLGNGGAAFDLVSSTRDPILQNDLVLQKMAVDYGPGHPHPEYNNNTHHLHNHTTAPSSNAWTSPVNFGQGVQFTFTHTSNHQPQSNRDELYVTRSDTGNLRGERDPFIGSSSSPTAFTPLSLSSTSTTPSSSSNTVAPGSVYTSNRAFFTLSRSVSRCWKRPKRS